MTRSGPGRWWVAPLALGILAWNLTPIGSGADLRLYREMAQTALAGGNPWTNAYADFPPLKMALFVLLERFDLWLVFRVLGFALFATLAMLVVERTAEEGATMLAGLLLVLSPVFFQNWLSPFEDKFVYAILALAAIRIGLPDGPASPARIAGVSAVLGLLAGYGWSGALLLPVLAVFALRRRPGGSTLALVLGPFAAVVLLAHLPFFPEWLAALRGRAHRQTLPHPVHQSLFLLLDRAHLYRPALPSALALAWVAAAALLAALGGSWAGVVALAHFGALGLGPDASFDRILAAAAPAMVLAAPARALSATLIVLLGAIAVRIGVPDMRAEEWPSIAVWAPILLAVGACAWREWKRTRRAGAPAE